MDMLLEKPSRTYSEEVEEEEEEEYEEERRPRQIVFQSKRDEREREKTLQKKIGELQTQTQRLERRIMLLKTENDTLKKKQEDQKPLEEKIKVLKKRNAELATIARRLEEKAKALQQENAKNKTKTKGEGLGTADGEHLKRMFARQRAKDLAEHAKSMLAKDREIEELRTKCQELADALSNGDVMAPENVHLYEEKEELVNIVKQAAKERLQLEQQLAHSKTKEVRVISLPVTLLFVLLCVCVFLSVALCVDLFVRIFVCMSASPYGLNNVYSYLHVQEMYMDIG
ncbi:peripheral-type benzodiazepine receptor-associated protein 1-like isoform X2 [Littorina saxatilis]|uniref:peripheral-type benzodiazepine receptor-associated protein 1-like isoform X2 n=1 Tax=Littorina saxatilis TaxID=31220 RepID=UPI0038B488D0